MSEQTSATENSTTETADATSAAPVTEAPESPVAAAPAPVLDNNDDDDDATTTAAPVTEDPKSPVAAAPAKPTPAQAPRSAPAPVPVLDNNDDDDDDDEYEDEDDDYHVPSEYAPSGSGRPRRIGSDVRVADISYKNIAVLSRFLDSRGRILSRRKTRVSAKVQRRIVVAIKRARHLALLPYTADQTRIVRKRR